MEEVTRMHYYNGLFLKEEDFVTEQKYNIQMRRLMNWQLNRASGVLEGLKVETLEGKKYKITPGIAISNTGDNKWYGTEVVLISDHLLDFSDKPHGDYYITLTYDEVKGGDDPNKGSDKIHWIERPKPDVQSKLPDSPEKDIVLAKITVPEGDWECDSKYVNTDERKEIGPTLRSINGKVGIGTSSPSEKLEVNGIVKANGFVGNTLEVKKVVVASQFEGDGMSISGTVKAGKFLGDGSGLTGIKAGQWTDVPGGISYGNKVGIGGVVPETQIHLSGGGWDLTNSEGDLKIGDGVYRLKIGVARGGGGAGDVRIRADGGTNRLMLGGGKNDTLTITQGNVGIGTTTPGTTLDVKGDVRINDKDILLRGGTDKNHGIGWYGGDKPFAKTPLDGPAVFGWSGGALGTTNNGQKIALKWDANGNVGIGESFPSGGILQQKLEVNGNVWVIGGVGIGIGDPRDITGNNKLLVGGNLHMNGNPIYLREGFLDEYDVIKWKENPEDLIEIGGYNGVNLCHTRGGAGPVLTPVLRVHTNGITLVKGNADKPGGGSWTATSDARLKKNVEPLTGALNKLLMLRGVSFEWIEPEKQGNLTGKQMGLIADEVEEVFPEWVGSGKDGYKNLTIRGFEALSIEAIRELNATNEELRAKNQKMEDRIKELERRLEVK